MKLIRKHNELNLLKESNDFDWINDIQTNPFLSGENVVVWLDRPITEDESETLLNFVRESGIEPNNYKTTINTLVRYSKTNNGYIRTSDGILGYGSSKTTFNSMIGSEEYKEYNEYNVSDLFGSTINESNDMDWIKDIDIVDYIEKPYFKSMKEHGLSEKEYPLVLSKIFNQPVTIKGNWVYNTNGKRIYFEDSTFWYKKEYDTNGNLIYYEDSDGDWEKYEFDDNGNEIYYENSDGVIIDNTNLNESDDFDWIRDVQSNISFHNVKVGEKYNVELTGNFYGALNDCFGALEPYELMGYQRTTNVRIIGKDMMKHSDVHCYSGNDSKVISLHLEFYNDNGTNIADHFWVTEEMVNLYPRTTDLNESDELDWIRDIEQLPIPGTAWVMEINPEDSEEVQHKLFDAGFGWSFGGKQIHRTPGIVAFASYGAWDISDKSLKWVPNGSYNLDYIINHVQPNDLYVYEYKNGISKLKETNLNESDDMD